MRHFSSGLNILTVFLLQDMFAKKDNKAKETLGSSHLICPEAEGQKYQAALKWSLPVVNKDWLLACLRDHCWVSERPFLVGECKTFNEDKPMPREQVEAVPSQDETKTTIPAASKTLKKSVDTPG